MKNLFAVKKTEDNSYTKKIQVPQYAPSSAKPFLEELVHTEKYSKLLYNINHSNVTEEEKKMLRFAAARHLTFNYAKIADYYAHATPEMQDLMEQSALIILDIDDAIANGYVKLSKDIRRILEESGEIANEG
jgi:hypothetical protein